MHRSFYSNYSFSFIKNIFKDSKYVFFFFYKFIQDLFRHPKQGIVSINFQIIKDLWKFCIRTYGGSRAIQYDDIKLEKRSCHHMAMCLTGYTERLHLIANMMLPTGIAASQEQLKMSEHRYECMRQTIQKVKIIFIIFEDSYTLFKKISINIYYLKTKSFLT